ncbi:hypothetical protein B0I35DRAFT_493464 [Stachybotrys elegans]|uniref:Uncharacterized protein n=1 Tax=Stachybotrys elegans TaxID=80388 RepID=A0A8K0SXJ0_9HYPO|nr:hypothetical protein B0I35DRAFT_493464 [Stachybotrys elegans]
MTMSPDSRNQPSGEVITAFDGAIVVRVVTHPDRLFAFDTTFILDHPRLLALADERPPLHFHPYQDEFVEVLEGELIVEVEGTEHCLTPQDGEFTVQAWASHRLYPPRKTTQEDNDRVSVPSAAPKRTRFILSADETPQAFKLDLVFFRNWYAYQDSIVLQKASPDMIQIMCTFDAGGSYLSFAPWIPFNKAIARCVGIVAGRWIGGLVGYRPFYSQWTPSKDWETARDKMNASLFYRSWYRGCEAGQEAM